MVCTCHENTVLGYYEASKFNAGQENGSRSIPSLKNCKTMMFWKIVKYGFSFPCVVVSIFDHQNE